MTLLEKMLKINPGGDTVDGLLPIGQFEGTVDTGSCYQDDTEMDITCKRVSKLWNCETADLM